jgi:hypothetical protein
MPCYLRYVPEKVKPLIKTKGKLPTKDEAKAGLKEALKQGLINTAQYGSLVQKVDACVEVKGHTHVHDEHFEYEHVH